EMVGTHKSPLWARDHLSAVFLVVGVVVYVVHAGSAEVEPARADLDVLTGTDHPAVVPITGHDFFTFQTFRTCPNVQRLLLSSTRHTRGRGALDVLVTGTDHVVYPCTFCNACGFLLFLGLDTFCVGAFLLVVGAFDVLGDYVFGKRVNLTATDHVLHCLVLAFCAPCALTGTCHIHTPPSGVVRALGSRWWRAT